VIDEVVTILIVDDDPAVRDSLSMLLGSIGYRTEEFSNALDFIDAAKKVTKGCGVVDVGLPDINGLVLQELLAKQGIALPILIVTGHGDVPMAVKAMRAGAVDFLEKPFSEQAVIASIERAVALSGAKAEDASGSGLAKTAQAEALSKLTPREREVLERLIKGEANKVIAYKLGISARTVELHRSRVMKKTDAGSLPELVRLALAAGVEPPED
jgi:two-component system response regulator FixJ